MAVTLNVQNVDANRDGKIDQEEWNKWYRDNALGTKPLGTSISVTDKYGNSRVYTLQQLQEMHRQGNLAATGEPKVPEKLDAKGMEELRAKISTFDQSIEDVKSKIAQREAQLAGEKKGESARAEDVQLKSLKARLEGLQQDQKNNIKTYEAQIARDGKKSELGKNVYENAGMKTPQHLTAKAQTTTAKTTVGGAAQPSGQAGTQGSNNQQANGAKAQTTSGGFAGNWGAQTLDGPKFSTAAYAQSLLMEDNVMSAWDGINANKNRGQQLMQVLFYYMRMAMSGDLMAMYQMMKAVLYIISKDKALQQVNMANKLIELQDASRRATDKLLNFKTDANDPNNQNEFTKMLQSTKSESDSIATSQKLIAQMMEEMAQIVETLTNVTKGALDAAGRVMRKVSTFQ